MSTTNAVNDFVRHAHRYGTLYKNHRGWFLSGVDYGAPLSLKKTNGRFRLFHRASVTGWAGVGHRMTYPAEYIIFETGYDPDDPVRPWRSRSVWSMNSGRCNWREVKRIAHDKLERLAGAKESEDEKNN